ncbi:hypothetical protein UY3_16440 [Chelonia mydas]|uniref:Transmembrane protein 157 n=1 Tax=Chelonia mydas TaxID=8469 RepID=M7BE27_CHEMY|nr:hypothetical protein UY3_16440 [Chelonia mydas]
MVNCFYSNCKSLAAALVTHYHPYFCMVATDALELTAEAPLPPSEGLGQRKESRSPVHFLVRDWERANGGCGKRHGPRDVLAALHAAPIGLERRTAASGSCDQLNLWTQQVIEADVYEVIGSLRKRNKKTRRYGVLDTNIENMELTPLEQDDDDDDTTLFDANHPRRFLIALAQPLLWSLREQKTIHPVASIFAFE